MRNKNSFGKKPYEQIPDGFPDPDKLLSTKKMPLGELLRHLKEKRRKPETKDKGVQK